MKHKRLLVITTVLLLSLAPCLAPECPARAAGPEPCSLTVALAYDKAPLSGIPVSVCLVADLVEESDEVYYTAVAAFAGAGVDLENVPTKEENVAAAKVFLAYAKAHNVKMETVVTNSSGGASFDDLAHGMYLVVPDGSAAGFLIDPFLVLVPSFEGPGKTKAFNVIASPKAEPSKTELEPVEVTVYKLWPGTDNPPSGVSVQLYKDGRPEGPPVILNNTNKWRYTWKNLSPASTWTVDEINVPEGFTKSIAGTVEQGFVITNARGGSTGTPGPSSTAAPSFPPTPTPTNPQSPAPRPPGTPEVRIPDGSPTPPVWITLPPRSSTTPVPEFPIYPNNTPTPNNPSNPNSPNNPGNPSPPPATRPPLVPVITGDINTTNLSALCCLSAAGALILIYRRRKKQLTMHD